MKKLLESSFDIGGFEGLDTNFQPDFYLEDNQILRGYNWSLEVVFTPGHLADHLCFAMEGNKKPKGVKRFSDLINFKVNVGDLIKHLD